LKPAVRWNEGRFEEVFKGSYKDKLVVAPKGLNGVHSVDASKGLNGAHSVVAVKEVNGVH
jgi:hypothetical protein